MAIANNYSGRILDDLLFCVELKQETDAKVSHTYRRWPTLSYYLDEALVTRSCAGQARAFRFEAGNMSLSPNGVAEKVHWVGEVSALHLMLSPKLLGQTEPPQVKRRDLFHDPFLSAALLELMHLGLANSVAAREQGHGIVQAIASHIARHHCIRREATAPRIGRLLLDDLIDQMHDHFAARNTVARLAKMARLSERRLGANFSNLMGKSPHQYLMKSRLSTAKFMVRCSQLSLTEIAHEAGFYDQAHFIKAFKKDTGLTPSAYQKMMA